MQKKTCHIGNERFEWSLAFTGERSGGILPYSGWRNSKGITKDPLKIDILNQAVGMVNTYTKEINGQTNHQNNVLNCKNDRCELILGDGSKRIYKKVQILPSLLLGEEFTSLMAAQVIDPDYFLLIQEILPSGNERFFSYDEENHLIKVEMRSKMSRTFSWIHFDYEFSEKECFLHIETSDVRKLMYKFIMDQNIYRLTSVEGSSLIPVFYEYAGVLTKKNLPEGRFVEIEYK